MLEKLNSTVDDISAINSKLVILTGQSQLGKSKLLLQLAELRQVRILNVSAALGHALLMLPSSQRHLQAADKLKELANEFASRELLLLDNIELLFDQSLQLNPLDLLKRHAHVRCVVTVWPGELREDRLSYAETGHPEHQEYGLAGLVPFRIQ